MRLYLKLLIAGPVLFILGCAVLFGATDGVLPGGVAPAGFVIAALGPLTLLGGLAAYALRKPTPNELADQRLDDYRSWHFRPLGLLILVLSVTGFVAFGNWAEQYVPGINGGRRRTPLGLLFGVVCLGSV